VVFYVGIKKCRRRSRAREMRQMRSARAHVTCSFTEMNPFGCCGRGATLLLPPRRGSSFPMKSCTSLSARRDSPPSRPHQLFHATSRIICNYWFREIGTTHFNQGFRIFGHIKAPKSFFQNEFFLKTFIIFSFKPPSSSSFASWRRHHHRYRLRGK